MKHPLVYFDGIPHAVLREFEDFGITAMDLAPPPRRLRGVETGVTSPIRTHIDPRQTQPCPTPAQLLNSDILAGDTWSALSKRSLARFGAFFLVAEDPQRRLDSRPVVTLAHQVSLVRHILDTPGRHRVLIADEVGLGKTVVAGLIIQELLASSPGLRILYLAPARLVSNVGHEFRRLSLMFREWKSQDGDARLEVDARIIASIHRAVHPAHYNRLVTLPPWDIIVVDECHHLSDWAVGGGDPVMKYRLVQKLVNSQPVESRLLLLSGTPHQAHKSRFENLLTLLQRPEESPADAAGRVIYRTKEDVRDWDGNPLFPRRQVNPPIIVELESAHRSWLVDIHRFFKPPASVGSDAMQRAAGWKCAQALQWATSSPNAGLGYLVRQALRAGWTLQNEPLPEAVAALRPYRSGAPDEAVESVYHRLVAEIRRQEMDEDIDDIEENTGLSDDLDHEALADLIQQGIRLVQSPRQLKWERLQSDVLAPAGDEKVVLFAQPIETVMALAAWIKKKTGQQPAIIIGGQSDADRNQQVKRFKDPDGPQFLISSRAGGEGINLQFSRRLVHLDVPWNPMEMEQRVGRVHRFGSRKTVLVDTLVVCDSRETEAWNVARERLTAVASALVSPERFETVFSRVMCLIPPEELQSVLINSPASPLADADIQQLSALVDSGFQSWQRFHEKYAANQRQVRDQPAGLARWSHLKEFLLRHGGAQLATGMSRTHFVQDRDNVHAQDEAAQVVKLRDGRNCYVGDFEGGLFSGTGADEVGPLGLNIPPVAELLHEHTSPINPTGAAYIRWNDEDADLRKRLGDEVVVLIFARQHFRFDTVGGVTETSIELRTYAVRPDETIELSDQDRASLFQASLTATVRVRPVASRLVDQAANEERRLYAELIRPSEETLQQRVRYAVWPILAMHISK